MFSSFVAYARKGLLDSFHYMLVGIVSKDHSHDDVLIETGWRRWSRREYLVVVGGGDDPDPSVGPLCDKTTTPRTTNNNIETRARGTDGPQHCMTSI